MAELRVPSFRAYRIVPIPALLARDRDRTEPAPGGLGGRALRSALAPDVVRPLIADRADAYFAILVALLAARRAGDDAPTLDELRRRLDVDDEGEAAFLRDLLQLEAWGCLRRELEPSRVRGYSDARRDRFRHRLSADAAALLGWLEARSADRAREQLVDARERFADLAARVVELTALVSSEAVGAARRAQHLARSIEAELDASERSLGQLDVELRAYAEGRFDAPRLARIVAGLEDFLREHVAATSAARSELADRIEALRAAGFRARWGVWGRERTDALGGLAPPPDDGEELLRSWQARVAVDGALDRLARRVEASTRATIAALRRHVRLLVDDARATGASVDQAIRLLAAHGERVCSLGLWGWRGPIWAPGAGERLAPPLPRRRSRPAALAPMALGASRAGSSAPDTSASPEHRRRLARAWLERVGAHEGTLTLSSLDPDHRRDPESLRAWMTVARAMHLGRGRGLTRLGVHVEPRPGVVTLGDDASGLVAPDCKVSIGRVHEASPTWSCPTSAEAEGVGPHGALR